MAQTLRGVQVAPIPGRAGWLVRTALEDRLGSGDGERGRLPARGRARRRHYRLRHPLRQCGDARAADLARALPAGRRRARHGAARRHRRLRRRHRRRLLRICDRRGRADRARAARRSRSPTRSSRASRSMRRARTARPPAGAGEGQPGPDRKGAEGARRHPLLPAPRPRRFGQPRAGQGARRGDGRRGGADRPHRRRPQGRSGAARRRGGVDLDVRRRALDPGRAGRRRERAGARGAARGAGGGQSGGAGRRRA